MNSIGNLCAILASRETTVGAAAFGGCEQLAPWISSGVLVPAGPVATVTCTECDTPHIVDVETFGKRAGWYCDQVGFVEPEADSIAAFAVRCEALAEQLRLAFGLKRGANSWPTDAPVLWTLGEFEFSKFAIAACLVPNVGDLTIFNELCRFLRTPRGNPHATAILTNDDRDLSAVMLPDSVRIVNLTDVIGLDNEGRLSINRDALARLVLPERLLRPTRRGRLPTKREETYEIIAGLDREHKLDGLTERGQHRLARTQLQTCRGKRVALGWATFRDALLEYRSRAVK
jgi:hypothetical protein